MYQLYKGDCLDLMQHISDKSIDMILCDLPYGCTDCKWDKRLDTEKLWQHYKRIIKDNGAIILFATMRFAVDLISSNKSMFRYDLVWSKNRVVGFLNANKMPLRSHELMLVFYKKLPTYNPQFTTGGKPYTRLFKERKAGVYGVKNDAATINNGTRHPKSILQIKSHNHGAHSTQKPVALLEWLIKTYSNAGDTILDNCMGSGSTGIACLKNKRNFIGIELDNTYYEVASKNLFNTFKEVKNYE